MAKEAAKRSLQRWNSIDRANVEIHDRPIQESTDRPTLTGTLELGIASKTRKNDVAKTRRSSEIVPTHILAGRVGPIDVVSSDGAILWRSQ